MLRSHASARPIRSLLIAVLLWPALSFAQNLYIVSPPEGETVVGPTVTLRMSVSDGFTLGQDGKILLKVDGYWVGESLALNVKLNLSPGTHQIEAQLAKMNGKPISSAAPAEVKVTMDYSSFYSL